MFTWNVYMCINTWDEMKLPFLNWDLYFYFNHGKAGNVTTQSAGFWYLLGAATKHWKGVVSAQPWAVVEFFCCY